MREEASDQRRQDPGGACSAPLPVRTSGRIKRFPVQTGRRYWNKGPGEKKLETDRRLIRTRISALKAELVQVEKHRELIRGSRSKGRLKTAAIVGYTNAGKSTLLNTLTGAGVQAEDKLFATLDPTTRVMELDDGQQILLTDTVGFIRKLPHHLVEAFKSTLEEAKYAELHHPCGRCFQSTG